MTWRPNAPPAGWMTQGRKGFFPTGGETAHWWDGADFLCDEARNRRQGAPWWVAKDNGAYVECVDCAAAVSVVDPPPEPVAPAPAPATVTRSKLPSTGSADGERSPWWNWHASHAFKCDCINSTCAECELRLLGLGGTPELHVGAMRFLRAVYHHQGPIALGELLDRCGWTLPRLVKDAKGKVASECAKKGFKLPYRDSTDPETGERTFEWVRGRTGGVQTVEQPTPQVEQPVDAPQPLVRVTRRPPAPVEQPTPPAPVEQAAPVEEPVEQPVEPLRPSVRVTRRPPAPVEQAAQAAPVEQPVEQPVEPLRPAVRVTRRPPAPVEHPVEQAEPAAASWSAATLHFERCQPPEQERRRAGRADQRRNVTVWVPPIADVARVDRWGAVAGLSGRSRAPLPMRVCMGLWGRGHGTAAIAQIAAAVGVDVSSSAVGRLLKQAADEEDAGWHMHHPHYVGAELVNVVQLVAELQTGMLES